MEKTHPVKDIKVVNAIALYYKNRNLRDYILFIIGINTGLNMNKYSKYKVKFFREVCKQGYIVSDSGLKIMISKELAEEVDSYMYSMQDEDYMFPSRYAEEHITRQHLNKILADASTYFELKDKLSMTSLMKTFGYWHFNINRNAEFIREIFDIETDRELLSYLEIERTRCTLENKALNLGIGVVI